MSDDRLRELERRWRSSGADSDEAAWLSERIRTGALSHERVRAAAILQHPAALLVIGDPQARGWKDALADKEVAVRATMVILERLCRDLKMDLLPSSVNTMFLVVRSWFLYHSPELVAQIEACIDNCEADCLCPMPQPEEVVLMLRLASILGQTVINHVDGVNELMSTLALCTPASDEFVIHVLRTDLCPWLLGHDNPPQTEKAGTL